VIFDANARVSQSNQRAAALFGVSEEELAGRGLGDASLRLVDSNRQPLDIDTDPVRRVLASGEPAVSFSVGVLQPPLDIAWRTLSLLPVFGPDRRPRSVLATVAGRTVAGKPNGADWQLTARSMLKSGLAATMLVDRSGSVLEWNDRLLDLTGRGDIELIDAHLDDLCDVDAEWVWEQLHDERDEFVQGTTWALRADGAETAVVGRFAHIEWPDVGDAVMVQLLDPYDLLDHDSSTGESPDSQLFARAEIPMFLITDSGIIADANPRALELLGRPKLAVLGHPIVDHFVGLSDDRLRSCTAEARVRTSSVQIGTFVVRDRDGRDPIATALVASMSLRDAPSPYLVIQLVEADRSAPADHGRRPDSDANGRVA
jgi:PAS domain S-box-containing protein